MSGLLIDSDACIGCGRCAKACASGGIVVEGQRPNRRARATESCVLCGSCVDACPVNAISIERDEAVDVVDLDAYRDIWVFVQTDESDAVAPVAYELVGKARKLADERGCHLVTLMGASPAASLSHCEHLIYAGADTVVVCRDERLVRNESEVYARLVCDLAVERKPEIILYGATAFGRELAPRVAAHLQTGLTADCTVLAMDPQTGLLQQTRPAFGGNLMATIICPAHRPQMATVRPGIFKTPALDYTRSGNVVQVSLGSEVKSRVHLLDAAEVSDEVPITQADRLVVVGRGIGSKKNLALMRDLAVALGAELGCTRPVVEAGWLPYRHQVGQTGVTVSPKLLLSIGVSGAIQHVAGIGGAECIIAVNEDPDAPIFDVARYKVVGDAMEVAQELLDRLKDR